MRLAFLVGVLVPLALISTAAAGTMSHAYTVASFERVGADRAEVVLRAQPRAGDVVASPCREIAATIAYRPEFFLRQTWSRGLTRSDHRQAIVALEEAATAGHPVQFGVFDTLEPDASGRCVLALRGLALTPDSQVTGFTGPI